MYSLSHSTDDVQAMRQQAGRWLRTLRENAKMTQRELAKAIGIEYYTFISQIESGRGRVPPAQYAAFAQAYRVPLHDFVKNILRYYDPITHSALFQDHSGHDQLAEDQSAKDIVTPHNDNGSITELAALIARLEVLLEKKTP